MDDPAHSVCFPASCIALEDQSLGAHLQGYAGKAWPRLERNPLLNGVIFRWCSRRLAEKTGEGLRAEWLREGAALSEGQASAEAARVIERFLGSR